MTITSVDALVLATFAMIIILGRLILIAEGKSAFSDAYYNSKIRSKNKDALYSIDPYEISRQQYELRDVLVTQGKDRLSALTIPHGVAYDGIYLPMLSAGEEPISRDSTSGLLEVEIFANMRKKNLQLFVQKATRMDGVSHYLVDDISIIEGDRRISELSSDVCRTLGVLTTGDLVHFKVVRDYNPIRRPETFVEHVRFLFLGK